MKVEMAVTVLRAYGRPEAMAIADLLETQREVIDLQAQCVEWERCGVELEQALARLAELEGK